MPEEKKIQENAVGTGSCPAWGHTVDSEVMFYVSHPVWDLYEKDEEAFDDDDREARLFALNAHNAFCSRHGPSDSAYWESDDRDFTFTDAIWAFVRKLRELGAAQIRHVRDLRTEKSKADFLGVMCSEDVHGDYNFD